MTMCVVSLLALQLVRCKESPFPDDTFLSWAVPWGQQVPVLTLSFLLLVQPQLDEEPRVVAYVHPANSISPMFSRILPPQ